MAISERTTKRLEALGYVNQVGPLSHDERLDWDSQLEEFIRQNLSERAGELVRCYAPFSHFTGINRDGTYEELLQTAFTDRVGTTPNIAFEQAKQSILNVGMFNGTDSKIHGCAALGDTSLQLVRLQLLQTEGPWVFAELDQVPFTDIEDVQTEYLIDVSPLFALMIYGLGQKPFLVDTDGLEISNALPLTRRYRNEDIRNSLFSYNQVVPNLVWSSINWLGNGRMSPPMYPLVESIGLRIKRKSNGATLLIESSVDGIRALESSLKERVAQSIVDQAKQTTRTCPWCAEEIKSAAIVCRFCNRDVEPIS